MATEEQIGIRVTSKSDDAALKQTKEQIDKLKESAQGAEGPTNKLTAAFDKFKGGLIALAGAAVIGKVVSTLKEWVAMAMHAEVTQAKMNAVLKATEGIAGVTAAQIGHYAKELMRSTGIAAGATKEAATLLLTFKGVQGAEFFRAMNVIADMSILFGSMEGAAIQLGKALENPRVGLTALRRVGISFTDSEIELIERMIEMGQTAEAQRIILGALEGQLGGVAKSVGETAVGKWQAFTLEVKASKKSVGEFILELGLVQKTVDALHIGVQRFNEELKRGPLWSEGGGMDLSETPAAKKLRQQLKDWQDRNKIQVRGVGSFGVSGDAMASKEAADAAQKALENIIKAEEEDAAAKEWLATATHDARIEASLYARQQEHNAAVMRSTTESVIKDMEKQATTSRTVTKDMIRNIEERNRATIELAKAEYEAKITLKQAELDAVAGIASGVNALFGENKAVAVAMTIVETYVAAQSAFTRVMETPGLMAAAPALAAAAAASAVLQGMARVKAILDVKPGSGGGGGGGMATGGSTSSAHGGSYSHTMASPYRPGEQPRGRQGEFGSVTNEATHYTVNAIVGSEADQTLKKFEKRRVRAHASYKRGTVNRGGTLLGRS